MWGYWDPEFVTKWTSPGRFTEE